MFHFFFLCYYSAGHGGHRREIYVLRGRDVEVNNAIEKYDNRGEHDPRVVWIRRKMRRGSQFPRSDAEPVTVDPNESQDIGAVTENQS